MGRYRRRIAAAVTLCLLLMTSCRQGAGIGISDETKEAVTAKTNEVLALYSAVEKTVEENSIEVAQSFRDMKQQLIDMSEQVRSKLEDTTEEDGKQALAELEKIRKNLEETKKNVEEYMAEKIP